MEPPDWLIVGAGFAGSVCAERLASAGKRVLVIDKRDHIGGNAYDYTDEYGILVHKYGAHVFHTNSEDVWTYLSRFTPWRPYTHRVLSWVNGKYLPVPINRTTLAAFEGDKAAATRAMIEPYTRKQWGEWADRLSPTVLARVKARDTDDDRYFTDRYQAMPAEGYTRLFEQMLAHRNISIRLQTAYHDVAAYMLGVPIVWTGAIDDFFDYRFGRLPYRSAHFDHFTVCHERFQPAGVVNYPSEHVGFTRIVEFKYLTGQVHPYTSVAVEYPTADGEPYWPVQTMETNALYRQYAALAAATAPHVRFVGRLGTYSYLDIWAVVAQATKMAQSLCGRSCSYM